MGTLLLFQIIIFHVESHPQHTWYQQCVTFNAFPSERHEIAYAAFGMVMMYGLPLVVILFSYASILGEIFRRSRDYADGEHIYTGITILVGHACMLTKVMNVDACCVWA
jgi:gonadotropin-releasing hormone receptor